MTFGLRRKPQAESVRPTISQALEQSKDVFPLETLPSPAAPEPNLVPSSAQQVTAAKPARFQETLKMPRVEKRDLTQLLTPRPFKEWLSQCLDALSSDLGRPLVLFRTRPLKRKLVACAFSRVDPRHCLALSVGLTGNDLFRELEEQARNREFLGQVERAFNIRSPLAFTLVDKDGAYGLLMVDQTRPMSPEEQTGVYPYLQILTLQLALEDARDRSRSPQVAPQVRT
jgi:hypothetical protein